METIKDYKFEAKSENSFLQRQLEEKRKEIVALKHKCEHMDEMINYLKSLLINQMGDNSNYQSNKNQPLSHHEPSVNKK